MMYYRTRYRRTYEVKVSPLLCCFYLFLNMLSYLFFLYFYKHMFKRKTFFSYMNFRAKMKNYAKFCVLSAFS